MIKNAYSFVLKRLLDLSLLILELEKLGYEVAYYANKL